MEQHIGELIKRYPVLKACEGALEEAFQVLREAYAKKKKLLIAGNGGSAADSEHIVGELMKGFCKRRPAPEDFKKELIKTDEEMGERLADKLQEGLPAIALTGHPSLSSAVLNDTCGELGFAQQVNGYGEEGDVFLGISTSGNSKNVLYAAVTARAKKMKVIGLTGEQGGRLLRLSDVCIMAPEKETYKIQELHLPIYHTLCFMLEEEFYNE